MVGWLVSLLLIIGFNSVKSSFFVTAAESGRWLCDRPDHVPVCASVRVCVCVNSSAVWEWRAFNYDLFVFTQESSTAAKAITSGSIRQLRGKKTTHVGYACYIITPEQIELESPCCSGFEEVQIFFKTWPTGTFQLNSFRSYKGKKTFAEFLNFMILFIF